MIEEYLWVSEELNITSASDKYLVLSTYVEEDEPSFQLYLRHPIWRF